MTSPGGLLSKSPIQDQIIDHLWVAHSNGKYGFSIQKEIYLSCGGVADGKYF